MAPGSSWIETALSITGGFETTGDPFAAVAGDFDGQGISCGVLQWNVGQGSLQPLVKNAGEAAVMIHMPSRGGDFWNAMNMAIPEALATLRGWQSKSILSHEAAGELAAFLSCPEMREQQIAAAAHIAELAYRDALAWARQGGAREPNKKEFCWFFDLIVQNGGLKGLRFADVRNLIAQFGKTCIDDAICGWLKLREKHQFGYRDCRRNAGEWLDKVADADLDLFALSYLRALKSVAASQGLVLNRKATIATGRGWVNGVLFKLADCLA
jgi:hypothetical protein